MTHANVVLYKTNSAYSKDAPYHPSELFPEYPFAADQIDPANGIYAAVREVLHLLGLDRDNYDCPRWNPLGAYVRPGNVVIIKPNLVVDEHPLGQGGIDATVVHGSVIRPIIDYVWIALKGEGRIIIADSPIKEVDFDRILNLTGIAPVCAWMAQNSVPVSTLDLRDLWARRDRSGILAEHRVLPGDPKGYAFVDLGCRSAFAGLPPRAIGKLRSTATVYENPVPQSHDGRRFAYSVAKTILEADVIVSITKLKTHVKGGVTLSLKNVVGIVNEKRKLPHYRSGSAADDGDMHPSHATRSVRINDCLYDWCSSHRSGKTVLRLLHSRPGGTIWWYLQKWMDGNRPKEMRTADQSGGDWFGNDTVWRMTLDLVRVLLFADKYGAICSTQQRGYLSFIDGIVGGDGEGPLRPAPKAAGMLLAGANPVAVDLVGSTLMGFDYRHIPTVAHSLEVLDSEFGFSREELSITTNRPEFATLMDIGKNNLHFAPPRGWANSPAILRADLSFLATPEQAA